MSTNGPLPDDPEALRALARELQHALRAEQEARLAEQERARFFQREYERLARQVFGRRSERVDGQVEGQLTLLAAAEPAPRSTGVPDGNQDRAGPPATRPSPARGGGGRKSLPPHIQRVEVTSTDPGPTHCPCCGDAMPIIGEDRSERLEHVPQQYKAVVVVRTKRACRSCPQAGVLTQPAPPFALPKSKFGDGFLAKVLVDKYADNIPLRRQETRFAREGLEVAVSSLCRVVQSTAELLKHVVGVMADELRAGPFLQGDGSGLPILDGPHNTRIAGALWVYTDGDQAVFEATKTHEGRHAAAFLKGFEGVFLPDGASTYNAACEPDGVERAGCWAHARRKFFDAREANPRAFEALVRIRALFLLEREARLLDAEARQRLRQERAVPWLEEFKRWVDDAFPTAEPRGAWHGALQYVRNQWEKLVVFAEHADVPIDNNASERALRGPVTGRKNWLFAGSEGGAEAAAVHFSIMHSCMLAGVDPYAYLRDVLHRLPDATPTALAHLTPKAWAARAT